MGHVGISHQPFQGIGFRSLTEAIDTPTAGGRLVFQIFGSLAEFERQVIRERTMAGLAAARAMGRKGGRPPALSAKDLAAAKALLKDPTITVEEVARRLRVGPSTLYRHLPGGRSALVEQDADFDDVGRAFRNDVGRHFRSKSAGRSDRCRPGGGSPAGLG